MAKKSIVYEGVLEEDSFKNYPNRENASICQFLYFLYIDDIAKYVKLTFYIQTKVDFKYRE